jgi:hypothetical protein
VHRLDRLNGNIPANPFDFKSLTLDASVQTDWPVYCSLRVAGYPHFWLCFVIFMGRCAGLCGIVHGCAGGVACERTGEFGRAKPFCAFFVGRIFRLRFWRHVGCSHYQESTGRGGIGQASRASCLGIGLIFRDVPCDRRSGPAAV